MFRFIITCLTILLLTTSIFAQKKVIKAKPEKEKKKIEIIENKKDQQKKPILRSKLQRPELINAGGVSVSAHDNRYMGFGALYGRTYGNRMSWTLQFQFFTVPSDQFYFDPYYYQFVQRDRGSMLMLTLSSKIRLPILQNEPNINPYWVVGAGPVLGIESDWNRQFPGSIIHAYSIGGFTTYTGPGLSYYIESWFLNFEVYYQLLRFPQKIFGKDNFDGIMFSLGIGKMF